MHIYINGLYCSMQQIEVVMIVTNTMKILQSDDNFRYKEADDIFSEDFSWLSL